MLFIVPVLRAVCDPREQDKLQEALPSVTRFKQPVSQRATCVATKLRVKLQEELPNATARCCKFQNIDDAWRLIMRKKEKRKNRFDKLKLD